MYLLEISIALLVAINLFAFFLMARDKRKSRANGAPKRTSEGFLFFLAAAFGSIGVYAGMLSFRHKTKRWYFQLGIPLLIIQNFATLYLVTDLFGTS